MHSGATPTSCLLTAVAAEPLTATLDRVPVALLLPLRLLP